MQSLLDTLSAREIRHVQKVNKQTNYGYLAGLWDEFLRLEVKAMKHALDGEQFHGMAWQSLLQANPFIMAKVGNLLAVRLSFAWVSSDNVPLLLGQFDFFMKFDVCFYRSQNEFEVKPKSTNA